ASPPRTGGNGSAAPAGPGCSTACSKGTLKNPLYVGGVPRTDRREEATPMGLLDRLLGREDQSRRGPAWNTPPGPPRPPQRQRTDDEVAIDRYRYMLRTAPPEQVEQAHAEAFAKLTPQQRQQVLAELSDAVPVAERVQSDDPRPPSARSIVPGWRISARHDGAGARRSRHGHGRDDRGRPAGERGRRVHRHRDRRRDVRLQRQRGIGRGGGRRW